MDDQKITTVNKSDKDRSEQMFKAFSMYSVAIDFAVIIAVPLFAFVFLGKWADKHFHTKYLVLLGIFIGLTISTVAITRQIKKLAEQMKNKK